MDELPRRPKRAPHFAAIQTILTENNGAAWPFVQPVNKEEVPDYYTVVQEPMALVDDGVEPGFRPIRDAR